MGAGGAPGLDREISRPVLDYLDNIRRASPREVVTVFIPEYLVGIRHFPLVSAADVRRLGTVDPRMFAAGLVGRASHQKARKR